MTICKLALLAAVAALTLSGCGGQVITPDGDMPAADVQTAAPEADNSPETTAQTDASAETAETEDTADTTARQSYDDGLYDDGELLDDEYEEEPGILSAPEDIGLYDVDGGNTNFSFTYGGEQFTAVYTPDNWKIIDSYRITNLDDMTMICQALSDVNPIHGSDMESWRTAEDMAYEWSQHNLAYAILPEDNAWRNNAKDVDINPADQGKNIYEMYKDRTGESFDF